MTQQEQTSGNITAADVAQAVGEGSPFDTNASKLRAILGRGSLATIQKHLETMRAQRIAAAQPEVVAAAPKAPAEVVDALWTAAWSAAQAKTLARLEALSAERDGLLAQSQAQAADILDLMTSLDALDAKNQAAVAAQTEAAAAAQADALAAQETMKAQADALAAAQAATAKTKEDAAHATELAVRDAMIERQTMQMTVERLTEQLSELKALHIVQATKHEKK